MRFPGYLLCLLTIPCLHAQQVTASKDASRLGNEALSNGLWEVACHHYQKHLENPSLDSSDRSETTIRFAEALLRSGLPARALELASEPSVANHPEATFWRAQALTSLGQYNEALRLLAERLDSPNPSRFLESILTAANLHLALGNVDHALEVLQSPLPDSPDYTPSPKPALRSVEILLDAGRSQEARLHLPDMEDLPPDLILQARFLEGRLLLEENMPEEAASRFHTVMQAGLESHARLLHLAAVAYCDALLAQDKKPEALEFITGFLQQHPDSSQVPPLFERLLPLLPPASATADPIRILLNEWCGSAPVPATGLIASWDTDAIGALPGSSISLASRALTVHAIYGQALSWLESSLPTAEVQARHFINRLLTEAPSHPLGSRLIMALAKRALAAGEFPKAFDLLDSLLHTSPDRSTRGESAFLQALAFWQNDNPKQASGAFLLAADSLDQKQADTARFNSYAARLIIQTDEDAGSEIHENLPPAIRADLALERALASTDATSRKQLLEAFLTSHPDHPRTAEARLAAADAALSTTPPDISYATAQLDTIETLPEEAKPPAAAAELLRIRIADRKGDSENAIRMATGFLNQHAGSPNASEIMFLLGRNLYQAGKYNDARLALERLASIDKDPNQAQACWLLSARAAAQVATTPSKQESLILFDKAISLPGPLSHVARMEKARLLIDMARPAEARELLGPWFENLPADSPIHLPGGFLLAEAIRSQSTPQALEQSMAIYDQLLEKAKSDPAAYHRLQYLRGLTFEQMGSPDSTAARRTREAFVAYYSVLETQSAPAEWYYFELCGFKALGMLIDAGRWPAAIACARRIASFHGPRADEATEIATQLQLKHMIWED